MNCVIEIEYYILIFIQKTNSFQTQIIPTEIKWQADY